MTGNDRAWVTAKLEAILLRLERLEQEMDKGHKDLGIGKHRPSEIRNSLNKGW